jgi:hypothetical protein
MSCHRKLQQHLSCKPAAGVSQFRLSPLRKQPSGVTPLSARLLAPVLSGNTMRTMVQVRTTDLHAYGVRLTRGPAAAAEARGQVRAAISGAGDAPVDGGAAILPACEPGTNAVKRTARAISLGPCCTCGRLRVDVPDLSPLSPALDDVPADAEAGRRLVPIADLAAEWGLHRTPASKVVYLTPAFQDPHHGL